MSEELQANSGPNPTVTVKELDELTAKIFTKRQEIDDAEGIVKKLNGELRELKSQMLSYLKELDRESYKAETGSISMRQIWKVSGPKTDEDKTLFFNWLKDRGLFERYASINHNSLNSLYMAEWEAAKQEDGGLTFSIPGIHQPSLFEDLYIRASKGESNE